ncbi:MAG TPA: efflux RND transporter permease subunit [Gemmatimonadota bacterium]|nr:efflux RND transporter permease subunit [Gemmatimonadota bacterium]
MIRLAIRRPVATVMAFGCLAVLGIPSAITMPLELLPDVEFPRLEVMTFWPGASPELVEPFVTSPIEAEAQEIRGVESVRSTSYPQRSSVTVEFAAGTDMEFARLELGERLSALSRSLPVGAGRPEVQPYVPDEFAAEAQALLVYTMVGPSALGALREHAVDELAPELAAVQGVGTVEVFGGTERELRVRLDPSLLAAYGLTPEDARRAIASGLNVSETAATLRRNGLEVTVAIDDRAETLDDVEAVVLRSGGAARPAVRLGDVARIGLTYADPFELHRVDGVPAVSLYLYRQPGSNAVAVVDRARQRLEVLRSGLPAGYRLIEDYDGSEKIRNELGDLRNRALLSAAAVLLVLFVAFRRWRPALLVFGTIAVSVLVTLDLMALAGLSLNLLTLAGLAMGIGLIVDNAIVVLESVEGRRDRGAGTATRAGAAETAAGAAETAAGAAEAGARQVFQPVLAATLTTIIVFAPFLYLQGELRAYYVPFAITVGLALLVSLVVAFTLIPALRAHRAGPGASARADWPRRIYGGGVEWTVRHRWITVGGAFLLLALSAWVFIEKVPRGRTWAGWGDETYLSIQISMPRGAEIERTDEIARKMEERLLAMPAIERYVTRVRSEHAGIRVTFPDSLATTWVPLAIKEELVAYSHTFGGAEVRVYGFGPSFYGGGGAPPSYSLKLLGYSYVELERLADDLAARLVRFPRIRDVDPNASGFWFERDVEMELVLTPDRARLAGYGLTVERLLDQVSAFTRGQLARDVAALSGEEVDLSVKIEGANEADVGELMDLVVATEGGDPVRVSDVATLAPRELMGRIIREEQQYQRIVSYEFRGPRKLGDHVRDAVVAATVLPSGYTIETERSFWEYEEGETRDLALIVVLAVALIYMVTAALFESLRAPLVVLAAVPLALIGVFLLYFYTGETFTREAWIGVIMMAGIVVNNAILIVDRIGALWRGSEGPPLPLREAAVQGTLDRVRPILMTTGTTVFGLLPLVLFAEPGTASLWRALALATIGGLVASTLLVLVTIPALYALLFPERKTAMEVP